tara:strand:+ start:329 stop:724 length:396 start_codon:yes stop_codon:yes gene_type:complete
LLKTAETPNRSGLLQPVKHGLFGKCPHCGVGDVGDVFEGYLKPTASCCHCGERFDAFRTDDIAPYFTILVVGHLIVPLVLLAEKLYAPPLWVHGLVWPALTLLTALITLPRIKGAVLGWMWWLGLRGDEQH